MMRRLALSYWTPILAGLVLLGLHLVWAIRWDPARRGEIATGFGACLIVLGLVVAARPYVRAGRGATVAHNMPPLDGLFLGPDQTAEEMEAEIAEREAERVRIAKDVVAEREVAVVVIAIGTLLNGYGPALVRLLGLEVSS